MQTRYPALAAAVLLFTATAATADTVRVTTYSELVNAVQTAPPTGRTIILAPGVYYQTGSLWIYNKPHLTLRGETGNPDDVVLQGLGIDNPNQHHNIAIVNCPYFTIENLTLRDTYWHGIQVNQSSHYVTIRNVVMIDNGESGIKATNDSSGTSYSDYGLVENCWIGFSDYGHRDCVEGIDLIATKDWVIRNNLFVRVRKVSGYGWGFFAKGNAQDTVVENNIFYLCDLGASFGNGGTGTQWFRDHQYPYEHRGGIIRNNIMIGGKDAAVYLNKALNAKVYNNLSYKHVLTFQARYPETYADFKNNIAVLAPGSYEPVVRWRDGANDLGSSNNVYGNDSWFVAPAISLDADFHLTHLATGAIDQGYSLPDDVPLDMDGIQRPQGSAWDIGPYEYIPNQPPTVDAGDDQEAYEGQTVHLHAEASDPDGDPLTYYWQQISGKTVTLEDADTADPYFIAPALASASEATLTFTVVVDDGNGGQAYDLVSVRCYMLGDANHDDSVNILDLMQFVDAWGSQEGDPNYDPACDFDGNGRVDIIDLMTLADSWGRSI